MRTYAWLYSSSLLFLLFFASIASAQSRTAVGTSQAKPGQAVATTTPSVRVTVENPREINIGKPATFVLAVTNQGKSSANEVVIVTNIPTHVELTKTAPEPADVDGKTLTFRVGSLSPGATRHVTLVAVPRTTDPIRLNATTTFDTTTQSTVLVRQPMLKLSARALPAVEIGTEVDWVVRATNTGDGRADDIVVSPQLLEGEVKGTSLQQSVRIGALKAGESKELQFTFTPTKRGKLSVSFKGSNADGLEATEESTFKVLQADLAVAAVGPAVQPLAREGTYEIRVTNPGDASTGSTMVVVNVPTGLQVTAAAENAYDAATRTLRWRITKVRPNDVVRLPFRAETIAAGEQTLKVVAQSKQVKDATTTLTTAVISRSNLIVTIVNDQELAAVSEPVGFKVAVTNAGSKPVEDLRVRVAIPEGLEAVDAAGYQVTDGQIEFPAKKLASGEKVTLAFTAVGNRVGEHRVKVLVNGGTLTRELTFEGSTYCYSNEEVPVKTNQPSSFPTSIE